MNCIIPASTGCGCLRPHPLVRGAPNFPIDFFKKTLRINVAYVILIVKIKIAYIILIHSEDT